MIIAITVLGSHVRDKEKLIVKGFTKHKHAQFSAGSPRLPQK
jgi:hypothetical protein